MKFNTFQNRKPLKSAKQLGWNLFILTDLLKDDSRNVRKIKKSDYLENGQKPIIDQGKQLIGGYTNLDEGFYNEESYIVFGDHTRIIKYIDFPSFIGADGVKVLRNKNREIVDTKYLYYFLQSINIPDAGYSRHFKFLKEVIVPVPPQSVQLQIVNTISKVHSITKKREQQIEALSALKQSVFLDMFGDPVKNPNNFNKTSLGEIIEVLTDYHSNGSYKTLKENVELLDEENFALMVRTTDLQHNNFSEGVKYIDESAYEFLEKSKVFGGEIIINKIGSAGKVYLMPFLNRPTSLGMNQFLIRINDKSSNEFIYRQLKIKTMENEIQKRVRGAVTKTITKDAIRSIDVILPPYEQQICFINKINELTDFISSLEASLEKLNILYDSLLHKAFKGELFK